MTRNAVSASRSFPMAKACRAKASRCSLLLARNRAFSAARTGHHAAIWFSHASLAASYSISETALLRRAVTYSKNPSTAHAHFDVAALGGAYARLTLLELPRLVALLLGATFVDLIMLDVLPPPPRLLAAVRARLLAAADAAGAACGVAARVRWIATGCAIIRRSKSAAVTMRYACKRRVLYSRDPKKLERAHGGSS